MIWQRKELTIGGRQILQEFQYSFAARVIKPWELDKILDSSIQEDTNFPLLAIS